MLIYYVIILFISIVCLICILFKNELRKQQSRILKLENAKLDYIKKLHALKKQIASDLHDEIGANLVNIGVLSHILSKEQIIEPSSNIQLKTIKTIVDESTTSLKNMVWFINPDNSSLINLAYKINKELYDRCSYLSIVFEFSEDNLNVETSPEFRKHVYLIFKESVQNIIKHSDATSIKLKLYVENSSLHFSIHDNGNGFDSEKINYGNGLTNLAFRAEQILGNVKVFSTPKKGTEVALETQLTMN